MLVDLQTTHKQKHHTRIISLAAEHRSRTLLTNSLPSGGQRESMSKFGVCYSRLLRRSQITSCNVQLTQQAKHALHDIRVFGNV